MVRTDILLEDRKRALENLVRLGGVVAPSLPPDSTAAASAAATA